MNDFANPNGFTTGLSARPADFADAPAEQLLAIGTEKLGTLKDERTSLAEVISGLLSAADDRARDKLRALEGELHAHSATITVVGQVKAGKTSVINMIVGKPGFLPSDVNPWTSVVTTVHVN